MALYTAVFMFESQSKGNNHVIDDMITWQNEQNWRWFINGVFMLVLNVMLQSHWVNYIFDQKKKKKCIVEGCKSDYCCVLFEKMVKIFFKNIILVNYNKITIAQKYSLYFYFP